MESFESKPLSLTSCSSLSLIYRDSTSLLSSSFFRDFLLLSRLAYRPTLRGSCMPCVFLLGRERMLISNGLAISFMTWSWRCYELASLACAIIILLLPTIIGEVWLEEDPFLWWPCVVVFNLSSFWLELWENVLSFDLSLDLPFVVSWTPLHETTTGDARLMSDIFIPLLFV